MNVSVETIGKIKDKELVVYTLENDHGMMMRILNLGCTITELITPDKNGKLENVVVGLEKMEDYLSNDQFFGAIIGRVAGRIKNATFKLEGKTYHLAKNEGENHLHGGIDGFHTKIWDGKVIEQETAVGVEFTYVSKDGEEGYPGNVSLSVTYLLNNENEWIQIITGETDKTTLVNLTNHTYFNLSGDFKRNIKDHILQVKSDHYLKLADDSIPTGELVNVDQSIFDLSMGRKLSEVIQSNDPQLVKVGNGFDHPFMLDEKGKPQIILSELESGRKLTIETNQPCVIVYTGNNINDDFVMKGGQKTYKHCALCLETQLPPDAIHHDHFPSIILKPDEKYFSLTKYRFDILS